MKIIILFLLVIQILFSKKLDDSNYYDAFGLIFSNGNKIVYIARRGISHVGDNGHIHIWNIDLDSSTYPILESDEILLDSNFDDRNIAGGMTKNNTAIIFYSEYDYINNKFRAIKQLRCTNFDFTSCSNKVIYENNLTRFSPYGNMTILPNNRLMQTFYEHTNGSKWRLFAMFSENDGITWKDEKTIYESTEDFTGECSAIYKDNKIFVVTRNNNGTLIKFISKDMGKTFQKEEYLPYSYFSLNKGLDHSPILFLASNTIQLIFADRYEKKIKIVMNINDINGQPISIYNSNFTNLSNFGYPSILEYQNKFYAFFYDEDDKKDTDIHIIKYIDIIDNHNLDYQENGYCYNSGLKGYLDSVSRYCLPDTEVTYTFYLEENIEYNLYIYKVIHKNRTKKLMVTIENGYARKNHWIDLSRGIKGFVFLNKIKVKDKLIKVTLVSKDNKIFSADAIKLLRIEK